MNVDLPEPTEIRCVGDALDGPYWDAGEWTVIAHSDPKHRVGRVLLRDGKYAFRGIRYSDARALAAALLAAVEYSDSDEEES